MTTRLLAPVGARSRPAARPLGAALAVLTAGCLAVDAYVHLHWAGDYSAVRTSTLSAATLFRVQGALAAALAVAVVLRPGRLVLAVAAVVLGSAAAAVVLSTQVDLGRLGPVPDLYEPTWAPPGKTLSAWAEGAGTLLALLGLAALTWPRAAGRWVGR